MYPTFVRFRAEVAAADPRFAEVAAAFGLGAWRPGLALGERDGEIEVLIAPDGRTALLPGSAVQVGLRENAVLGLMDALEEAIEDAHESGAPDAALIARLEATLALLEGCPVAPETAGP